MIIINMEKARNIHRDAMRAARAPLFAKLDVDYMVATERGQDTSSIAAQKQALRDVTKDPAIDAAQTLDDLKSVWPDVLRG